MRLPGTCSLSQCAHCVSIDRPCEWTSASKPHQKCRECLIRQKTCAVGDDSTRSKARVPASPVKAKSVTATAAHPPEVPDVVRNLIAAQPSDEADRKEWLDELRINILHLVLSVQHASRKLIPAGIWAELVALGISPETRATATMQKWDLQPVSAPVPCASCASGMHACLLGAPSGPCRRCAVVNNECKPFHPPQPAKRADSELYIGFVNAHNDKDLKEQDKAVWLRSMRDIIGKMSHVKQVNIHSPSLCPADSF